MAGWKEVHKGRGDGSAFKQVKGLWDHFADDRTLISCLTGFDPDSKEALSPCKVTLFHEMGCVKLSISDPAGKRVGFVTLSQEYPTIGEALAAALEGGVDWRAAKEPQTGGFRR